MKQTLLICTLLFSLLVPSQGCVSFPESNITGETMLFSGVRLDTVEKLDNEPVQQPVFRSNTLKALSKLEHMGSPIEINDTESAAVVISASVSTLLLERVPAPGLDQGKYRTTLSVTFTSNYKSSLEDPAAVFYQKAFYNDNILASTPAGAAKKGAEWAAEYLVKRLINDNEQFFRHIPISKSSKAKSTETDEQNPES